MRANPLSIPGSVRVIPRLLAALSLVLAVLIVPASVGTRVASAAHGGEGDKVGVCHAAGQAGTLTYTYVEVPAVEPAGAQGHFTESGTREAGHEQDILDITEEECLALNEVPTEEPTETPTDVPDNQQDDKGTDTDTDTGAGDDKQVDEDDEQEELPTTGGVPVGGPFSLFGMAAAAVSGLGLFALRRTA
jgi:hypothetical protein